MPEVKWEIVGEIDKCPICGSPNRFAGSVADEEIKKGVFPKGIKFGLVQPRGRVFDPKRVLLAESKVPVISALFDVCLGYPDKPCGCVYAVRLLRGELSAEQVVMDEPPSMKGRGN